MDSNKKNFQVEELENRLEMAAIDGVGADSAAEDNSGCKNQGCAQNRGCTADSW